MHSWDDLVRADDSNEVSDFQGAANQLMSHQVLYESRLTHATAYRLIARNKKAFQEVFSMFAITLHIDETFRFVAAIPTLDRQLPLKKADALLLLVLRKAYHEEAMKGALSNGVAVVTIEELKDIHFRETRGRELPSDQRALREILLRMKCVLRLSEPDISSVQPFDVEILPGIVPLVSANTLSRLADVGGGQLLVSNDDAESGED